VTTACRQGCGACCIAPGINTPFYGMPAGKPAGEPCLHLNEHFECVLFGDPRRPEVCSLFQAEEAVCGSNRADALERLTLLEIASLPLAR
jgi:Fe-S-cluster containining protein